MKIPFLISCAVLAAAMTSVAGELHLTSLPGHSANLVELYTSEGCSSCPPADAWLSKLADNPRLWIDFVPVAFHVDYWNNLGWRDRFSSAASTARQREYAARWGSDTVYTPEFALNGREWQHESQPPTARADGGKLAATVTDARTVSVTYGSSGVGYKASVALLGFGLNSQVSAGENRGRRLQHDFVTLAVETKPLNAGEPVAFDLPSAQPGATRLGVAVWIARPDGTIEQATGGFLK